jgi:phytoene/squalene synthetase
MWSMRVLPGPRRKAMQALYGFCRELGDIADGEASRTLKLALPADWSAQIALLYALRRQRRPGEKLAGNPYYRRNAILSRLKFHRNKRAVICPSRTCVGA